MVFKTLSSKIYLVTFEHLGLVLFTYEEIKMLLFQISLNFRLSLTNQLFIFTWFDPLTQWTRLMKYSLSKIRKSELRPVQSLQLLSKSSAWKYEEYFAFFMMQLVK